MIWFQVSKAFFYQSHHWRVVKNDTYDATGIIGLRDFKRNMVIIVY